MNIADNIAQNRREIEALKSRQQIEGDQTYRTTITGEKTISQTSTQYFMAYKWVYFHLDSYDGSIPIATLNLSILDNRTWETQFFSSNETYLQQSANNSNGRLSWWCRMQWSQVTGGSLTLRPQIISNVPATLTIEEGELEDVS